MPEHKRTVLVTGGGQGLGEATVRLFASRGWQCVVLDAVPEPALALQGDLSPEAVPLVIPCDVADSAAVDRSMRTVLEEFGSVECLVNNAGIVRPSPSHAIDDEEWDALLGVHLGGTMRVSRAALPLLAAATGAAVVNLSSVCASRGFPGRLSYNAAKAGIEALTRTLAVEWGSLAIRVNAIAPGFIMTANSRALYERGVADADARAAATPLGRLGEPHEIAEAVFWLGSEAASYVTGQVLAVDGGFLVDGRTGEDPTSRATEDLVREATVRITGP